MTLTLEEAIKHCEEVAEEKEQEAQRWINDGWQSSFKTLTPEREAQYLSERKQLYYQCLEYASEHRQLAEWLKELKAYRENCNKPYWAEMEILPNAYDIMGDKTWASKMRCSNCNFITYAIEGKFSQYNYCPQCGVKIGASFKELKANAISFNEPTHEGYAERCNHTQNKGSYDE